MKSLTREQIVYIAGFFDGEGCVYLHGPRLDRHGERNKVPSNPRLQLTQKRVEVLKKIQKWTGCGRINKNSSGVYTLHFRREESIALAKLILPYSIVKQKELEVMLEFIALPSFRPGPIKNQDPSLYSRRFTLYQRLRGLRVRQRP